MRIPQGEGAALARRYTLLAYEVLLEMLRDPKTSPRVRKRILKTLYERGFIKSPMESDDPSQPSRLQ